MVLTTCTVHTDHHTGHVTSFLGVIGLSLLVTFKSSRLIVGAKHTLSSGLCVRWDLFSREGFFKLPTYVTYIRLVLLANIFPWLPRYDRTLSFFLFFLFSFFFFNLV